jgi:hypothetical protein
MTDYTKTIIYKLINYDFPELVYVGSTTNFTKRKYQHKSNVSNVNSPKYNRKLYLSIRENGNWESWDMIKICDYPCNNKREAEQEEDRHMIELKANLNMHRSSRSYDQYCIDNKDKIKERKKQYYNDTKDIFSESRKQYYKDNKEKILEKGKKYRENNNEKINEKGKKYYEDNKEKINEKGKKYYEDNKEKIKEQRTKKCVCECGAIIQQIVKARHEKSIKHQKYLESLN